VSGSTALTSFVGFAKLAQSGRHVTSRRITSETYFGLPATTLPLRKWNLHKPVPRLLSTSVLAVLGEGCQARPELNSSGLFFDLLFTKKKNTSAKRIFSRCS
jgi:hypothetical protein